MEPTAEPRNALGELDAFMYDADLPDRLQGMARQVQEIVPACLGLGLAYRERGTTFTLVACDAAREAASTLTLPIMVAESVVGSVNLYAETADAFDGHHEAVAAVFDAWAPGSASHADLPFETRRRAQEARRLMLETKRVQVAVGVLVATHGISVGAARGLLRESALRAGVDEASIARVLIERASTPLSSDERAS